jgi:hypothetical protein
MKMYTFALIVLAGSVAVNAALLTAPPNNCPNPTCLFGAEVDGDVAPNFNDYHVFVNTVTNGKLFALGQSQQSSAYSDLETGVQRITANPLPAGVGISAVYWDTIVFQGVQNPGDPALLVVDVMPSFVLPLTGSAFESIFIRVGTGPPLLVSNLGSVQPSGLQNWQEPIMIPFQLFNGVPTQMYVDIGLVFTGTRAELDDPPRLYLPPGVTYTTASGFHEFQVVQTPEPSSLVGSLLGLGIMVYYGRRRKIHRSTTFSRGCQGGPVNEK